MTFHSLAHKPSRKKILTTFRSCTETTRRNNPVYSRQQGVLPVQTIPKELFSDTQTYYKSFRFWMKSMQAHAQLTHSQQDRQTVRCVGVCVDWRNVQSSNNTWKTQLLLTVMSVYLTWPSPSSPAHSAARTHEQIVQSNSVQSACPALSLHALHAHPIKRLLTAWQMSSDWIRVVLHGNFMPPGSVLLIAWRNSIK